MGEECILRSIWDDQNDIVDADNEDAFMNGRSCDWTIVISDLCPSDPPP